MYNFTIINRTFKQIAHADGLYHLHLEDSTRSELLRINLFSFSPENPTDIKQVAELTSKIILWRYYFGILQNNGCPKKSKVNPKVSFYFNKKLCIPSNDNNCLFYGNRLTKRWSLGSCSWGSHQSGENEAFDRYVWWRNIDQDMNIHFEKYLSCEQT